MGVALLTAGFVGMVFTIQVPITSLPESATPADQLIFMRFVLLS